MLLPWAVVRRDISRIWNCKPWEVDEAPRYEILQELKLAEIEVRIARETNPNRPSGNQQRGRRNG